MMLDIMVAQGHPSDQEKQKDLLVLVVIVVVASHRRPIVGLERYFVRYLVGWIFTTNLLTTNQSTHPR